MPELDAVREQIEALRADVAEWAHMQQEIHTSTTRVHEHVCGKLEQTVRHLLDIVDGIEAVMVVRKTQVVENRQKLNALIAWVKNADDLKLKLGGVPERLPEID